MELFWQVRIYTIVFFLRGWGGGVGWVWGGRALGDTHNIFQVVLCNHVLQSLNLLWITHAIDSLI